MAGELPFNSMADPVSREKPEVRWQRQEERIASALITMQALRGAVEQWGQHKRSQAKNRPGRPPKPPKLELAGWVGYVLASAGVKLTTGRNGQWARAARVVYQVAGLPVPEAGFDRRILASSLEFLLQYIPETTKRNSAQKTLRRSRVDFRPAKIG